MINIVNRWVATLIKATALPFGLVLALAQLQAQTNPPAYRQDRILVKPRVPDISSLNQQFGTTVLRTFPDIGNIQVIQLPQSVSVTQAIAQYQSSGKVAYAEPDYIVYAMDTNPNDTYYVNGTLWNMHNTGQNGGVAGADIHAPQGWDTITSAPHVIVAVTDSGVRYTHQDLAANMWTNPNDGTHGFNVLTGTHDPNDDFGHGTHVAGIIGAVGNNGVGVVGVAWGVQIMAIKFLDSSGNGSLDGAITAIDDAIQWRANIINASWGGTGYAESLREAIAAARNQGILFVAAAGNGFINLDNDISPIYPASYDVDNIVSVAATTRTDAIASFSRYGLDRVHLGAPGDTIYSTYNGSDSDYEYDSGTSMAAPHVSGVLALMQAYDPVDHYVQLKNRLLSSTDPIASLSGRCQTDGRLDLQRALATTYWWPRNDNFANAFTIAKPSSASSITFVGNNVDATKETGEPNHAGNSGGKSVWWNWQAPDNNSVTFTTLGSDFDTLLAVYAGSSVSTLTPVASDDNSGQCSTSQVTFTPVSGTTYRIAVDGYNGADGIIKLTLQTSSASQPASLAFTLSSVQRSNGRFTATITGPASAVVTLDTSSDLNAWNPGYATITLNPSGSYTYSDTLASSSIRFYRASISSSGQQSCNVVGYVDVSMPAGESMIANPLTAADNRVSALFPTMHDGDTLYKFNDATQSYTVDTYFGGVWSDPNMTLAPGEGAIPQLTSAITHTWMSCPYQCNRTLITLAFSFRQRGGAH